MIYKEKNFVSAVIYVHNASSRIQTFLEAIADVLEENFEHSEIICVNDYSTDDSVRIIREIGAKTSVVISVLNMSYFHGVEISMTAGVDLAIGDWVFEFDNTTADYDKLEIMRIYCRALEGYDIVSAAADRKQRFSSKVFYHTFGFFSDMPGGMRTESFRILSRRVINRITDMNRTVFYRKAVYAGCGLKTDLMLYRPIGPGQVSDRSEKRYRTRLAIDTLIIFTDVGYRFSLVMTLTMMLASVFVIVYTVITYLNREPVEGWTTTMLFLSVAFLGLFGILTIIVKYLQLILRLVFQRKKYSFESIEKMSQ